MLFKRKEKHRRYEKELVKYFDKMENAAKKMILNEGADKYEFRLGFLDYAENLISDVSFFIREEAEKHIERIESMNTD